MDINKTNVGEKYEQFWEVGVMNNLSPMEIYWFFLNFSFQRYDRSIELIIINGDWMQWELGLFPEQC